MTEWLTNPWYWIAGASVALVGWLVHMRYWHRRLWLAMEYDSEEEIGTPDGMSFQLRRVPSRRTSPLPPVLMVHGLSANHRNQDVHPDCSLARELADAGRDVWLLTLRSGRSDLSVFRQRAVRFSAMARHDVPMAIDAVLERTGATRVDYVGFSMGGILLYAVLGNTYVEPSKIRRATIIGSPGRLGSPVPGTAWFFPLVPRLFVPTIPTRLAARTFAFLLEWFATPIHRLVYNPLNVRAGFARVAAINVLVDIPSGLNADFKEWVQSGGEITVHGQPILPGLGRLSVPALFVAGTADRIAPVESVRYAYEHWGSPNTEKNFVVLDDYGHGDLAVGKNVCADVHAPVMEFLGQGFPQTSGVRPTDIAAE